MGQYFELVIFTDEPSAYAIPVINKLDKHQASAGENVGKGVGDCCSYLPGRWARRWQVQAQ